MTDERQIAEMSASEPDQHEAGVSRLPHESERAVDERHCRREASGFTCRAARRR